MKIKFTNLVLLVALGMFLSACATSTLGTANAKQNNAKDNSVNKDSTLDNSSGPFASTYQVPESNSVVIRNATVLTGMGDQLDATDVLLNNGKIEAVGVDLDVAEDTISIDAQGKWVTPGIIDVHSHMGVYPSLSISSLADGNEAVAPATAKVWAEHSVWPQDPTFEKAIAGGITTAQILPGSANLFGGRGVTLKIVPSITMQGMKFPGAPHALKMACGENPKRVYGDKGGPSTRMGNMAGYRSAWIKAQDYRDKWAEYDKKVDKGDKSAKAPTRDLEMETLMGVLNGEIRIHNHCYRADEMVNMIDLSKEFGYEIAAFHHAVEAYKVAPILAENDICAVVWADWWGFKQEAYDMVRENAALVDYVGGCAIIHSDDEIQTQRLNQEVAKVVQAAGQMGLDIDRGHAIKWITSNAAKSIGLEDQIGSIEVDKNADVVLWNKDPFSVYAKAEKVWIDGALRYDRSDPSLLPTSDFNLGILEAGGNRP